jgi:hypothetical protein
VGTENSSLRIAKVVVRIAALVDTQAASFDQDGQYGVGGCLRVEMVEGREELGCRFRRGRVLGKPSKERLGNRHGNWQGMSHAETMQREWLEF